MTTEWLQQRELLIGTIRFLITELMDRCPEVLPPGIETLDLGRLNRIELSNLRVTLNDAFSAFLEMAEDIVTGGFDVIDDDLGTQGEPGSEPLSVKGG